MAKSDGKFGLRDLLMANTAYVVDDDLHYFTSTEIDEIDADALGYFAFSVVWRAAVSAWTFDGNKFDRLELGKYEDSISNFLLGKSALPSEVAVNLVVSSERVPLLVAAVPRTSVGECHAHWLDIPGMQFIVHVGSRLPEYARACCLFRGEGRPILFSSVSQRRSIKDVMSLLDGHRRGLVNKEGIPPSHRER